MTSYDMRMSDWSSDVCSSDLYAVTGNYASRSDDADRTVAEIAAAGGRAIAVKADVSLPADAARLFDETAQAFGGVDVLVNNAGIMTMLPIANADPGAVQREFAVNLMGSFNTMQQRSEEHTSELQSLMRISYAVFCLKKHNNKTTTHNLSNTISKH